MESVNQTQLNSNGFPEVSSGTGNPKVEESSNQFENRKKDHIELALQNQTEALGFSGLEQIHLDHCAIPELDFSEVTISSQGLGLSLPTPFLISSMTAGHVGSIDLNKTLAKAAAARGWLMGVGSQRKELFCSEARNEWKDVRKNSPKALLIGNLGLSQVIQSSVADVESLIESLEAKALFVHTNPLQECLQSEGTPYFKDGIKALEKLCRELSVPVILKETGCGFSKESLKRIIGIGISAVDVAGFGGTHWGRIEGGRNQSSPQKHEAAKAFAHWGISTRDSLLNAMELDLDYDLWASGGLRNGLDAAKVLSMGAMVAGYAKPLLQAALLGEKALYEKMETLEYELRVALFCTGNRSITELQNKKVWKWQR